MHEPLISLVGHVGGDPRHATTASGTHVTNFRLAVTPRRKDRESGEWADAPTLWFSVTTWRQLAENVKESVHKGDRVVVSGELSLATWKGDDGVERSGLEIVASSVGLDLSRTAAVVVRRPAVAAGVDPGDRPLGDLTGAPSGMDLATGEVVPGGVLDPAARHDPDLPDDLDEEDGQDGQPSPRWNSAA